MQSQEPIDYSKIEWPKSRNIWDDLSLLAPILAGFVYLCFLAIWMFFLNWIDFSGRAMVEWGYEARSDCAPRGLFFLCILGIPVAYMYCLVTMAMRRIARVLRVLAIAAALALTGLLYWQLIGTIRPSAMVTMTMMGLSMTPILIPQVVPKGRTLAWEWNVIRFWFVPIVVIVIFYQVGGWPGFCGNQYQN